MKSHCPPRPCRGLHHTPPQCVSVSGSIICEVDPIFRALVGFFHFLLKVAMDEISWMKSTFRVPLLVRFVSLALKASGAYMRFIRHLGTMIGIVRFTLRCVSSRTFCMRLGSCKNFARCSGAPSRGRLPEERRGKSGNRLGNIK